MFSIKAFAIKKEFRPEEKDELWEEIKEFSGKYYISDNGRVWSECSSRLLKAHVMQNGYLRVNLTHRNTSRLYSLHRLVAKAFIPNPENKPEVNHKDGNRANNHMSNLEWVTRQENQMHMVSIGNANIGVDRPDAKLNDDLVRCILKDRYLHRMTRPELVKKYLVSHTAIRHVISGKTWKHVDCPERQLINSFTRLSSKGKKQKNKRKSSK